MLPTRSDGNNSIIADDSTKQYNFSNFLRNEFLLRNGQFISPTTTKTGTTIVGVCFRNGVILGADTRATSGPIVADKNCEKIHYIAPNMYCCGAGTAADTEFVTNLISRRLELHGLNSRREVRVATAMTMLKQHLFRHQGHVGAALILGGVDLTGPHLYAIFPHGSVDHLPYATMGSGSLAAMSIIEGRWKANLSREEGISLVVDAIRAGIFNDLGSGSNVDVTVITMDRKAEVLRNFQIANSPNPKELKYQFAPGTTPVLEEQICNLPLSPKREIESSSSSSAMDTS